mgnify:CR=1 FL=1
MRSVYRPDPIKDAKWRQYQRRVKWLDAWTDRTSGMTFRWDGVYGARRKMTRAEVDSYDEYCRAMTERLKVQLVRTFIHLSEIKDKVHA